MVWVLQVWFEVLLVFFWPYCRYMYMPMECSMTSRESSTHTAFPLSLSVIFFWGFWISDDLSNWLVKLVISVFTLSNELIPRVRTRSGFGERRENLGLRLGMGNLCTICQKRHEKRVTQIAYLAHGILSFFFLYRTSWTVAGKKGALPSRRSGYWYRVYFPWYPLVSVDAVSFFTEN